MSCSATLSGIVRDCAVNTGGIKKLYICPIDDVTSYTTDADNTQITAITMASSKKFKGFYFKKGQCNVTSTPQFNSAGDYTGEQAVITVNFAKMDTTKRAQLHALSYAELAVIIRDENGKYWYYGKDNPVMRTGGESTTGQSQADFNHYGIELTANDNALAYEVQEAAAQAVIE